MERTEPPRVLIVEDNSDLAGLYSSFLSDEPVELEHVGTGRAALARINEAPPAVLLLDLELPDMDGHKILERVAEARIPTSVLVITGHGSVDVAVDAMRAGACDFLAKPFKAERLRGTLRSALERQTAWSSANGPRAHGARSRFQGFIGASPAMQQIYHVIESAAPSKAAVFITGESGTGKELCAQAIHHRSPRRDRPFVPLDCGAIPKDLLESAIFGHTKGAFTGAVERRAGAARLADGGTLFLDEICELDPSLQAKFLRFVQTGTFQQVGGDTFETVDLRLICATNRDPLKEIEAGRCRADLYYRLHVIPVHLPPLRERTEDIVPIACHLLAAAAREEAKNFKTLTPQVQAVLAAYHWPGNVRQLQNVIRNIVVLHDGEVVEATMLPWPLSQIPRARRAAGAVAARADHSARSVRPLRAAERELIEDAIARCGGNVVEAAQLLEISPSTIYRKQLGWAQEDVA